ncbi:hypothetical protein [Wolbachia pipientis]|uniref:hypothetical protein n=1 Tax=Wolbachia pipientis TaxID=955 RepID=UPI0025A33539|nr:hypothetical protein [Wolbachia pipientis]MDM8335623.1 hypothetical protein [Wolbachia pipientis]
MAIEKGRLFEIIQKVCKSEGLNEDNLLERVINELKGKDAGEHSKFSLGLYKIYPFSIKVSEKAIED